VLSKVVVWIGRLAKNASDFTYTLACNTAMFHQVVISLCLLAAITLTYVVVINHTDVGEKGDSTTLRHNR